MRKKQNGERKYVKKLKVSGIASCSDILVYNCEYSNQYAIV